MIRQIVKIDQGNNPLAKSESTRGPLVESLLTKRLTKANNVQVENDRVDRDKVDSTTTPTKAKGKS